MEATTTEQFEIKLHPAERIIEVVYPAHPTEESFERYEEALRRAVQELGAPWWCLVDQRALPAVPEDLAGRISELNGWAKAQGMQRSARLVKRTYVAQLQAQQIVDGSGLKGMVGVYYDRDMAWRSLTER